ncbi:MAG: hypothetical protein FD121_485 [Gallionellaceae bacterium]|nr:MAG: hypothetical protein FD121_485 [Gallionellaceae bacterium]
MLKLVCLLSLIASIAIAGEDTVSFKTVPLDEFMQKQLAIKLPIPIPVVEAYQESKLPGASVGYSYWMQPEDVEAVKTTGDLPSEHGYMYGKITQSVGYDKSKDIFIGVEDPQSLAKAKSYFATLTLERYQFDGHAILLVKMASADAKKIAYAMYIATNLETNVVYIALRPPRNSEEVGDALFESAKKHYVRITSDSQ